MPKPFRRLIMFLLAAAIVAAVPAAVSAAPQSSEKSMETALIAAKTLLKIDDSIYTDFTYSSSFSNYETMEGLIWSFTWSGADNAYINATVSEDGTLLYFWKYIFTSNNFGFAKISKGRAISIAGEFIRRAKPDSYSYYKAPADVSIRINDSEYRMSYCAEINGHSFNTAQINVSVNKFTGEITGYNTSNIEPGSFKFEDASKIISESAAIAAYVDKIGLPLEYKAYYNYDDGSFKISPVYLLNSGGNEYISAISGEVVKFVYDRGPQSAPAASAAKMMAAEDNALGGSSGSRASLSPAEIEAVEKVSSYISSEQALRKLLEAAELTDLDVNSFSERYISLNRDFNNRSRYFYNVNLFKNYGDQDTKDSDIMYIYGRVDAESGRVIQFSFNYFGVPVPVGNAYTEAKSAETVVAFLKKIAPAEFAKTKPEETSVNEAVSIDYRKEYYYSYIRYENGIAFRDNRINVSFNPNTGKITSYALNWFDNATFPSISNVMTPQRALSAYVTQVGSGTNYITVGEGKAALVYEFGYGYIDPFNGNALNYNGEKTADSVIKPDYSDVAGHWSEGVVKQLVDNGVYLWSGKFEPNKVMTELEFLQYLLLIEPYYYPPEPAEYFAQRGIDIAADPNKNLTRQEAVRIIVEYLGYGKLAKQSEWFVYPFTDRVSDEYKGYITICYMLGIINGSNGKFNASSNITRAQAAVILRNIITLKSGN